MKIDILKEKKKVKRHRAFRPKALKDCFAEVQIQLSPTLFDSYIFPSGGEAFLKLTGTSAKVMKVDLPSVSLLNKALKHNGG